MLSKDYEEATILCFDLPGKRYNPQPISSPTQQCMQSCPMNLLKVYQDCMNKARQWLRLYHCNPIRKGPLHYRPLFFSTHTFCICQTQKCSPTCPNCPSSPRTVEDGSNGTVDFTSRCLAKVFHPTYPCHFFLTAHPQPMRPFHTMPND